MSLATTRSLVDDQPDLLQPTSLCVDSSLSAERARHLVRIGQLLYTFWHTGEVQYLDQAIEPAFVDNTLPEGRPQGPAGPVAASAAFRAAVPDLTCEVADMLVVGDKIAVRLRFRGHFTGIFNGVHGSGQEIDFIAFDIQHAGAGPEDRIVEDWHLEDNLAFLTQAGLATVLHA